MQIKFEYKESNRQSFVNHATKTKTATASGQPPEIAQSKNFKLPKNKVRVGTLTNITQPQSVPGTDNFRK